MIISATIFLISLYNFFNIVNTNSVSTLNTNTNSNSNEFFISENKNSSVVSNATTNSNLKEESNNTIINEYNEIDDYIKESEVVNQEENILSNNSNAINAIDTTKIKSGILIDSSKENADKESSMEQENENAKKNEEEENGLILFEVHPDPNDPSNNNVIGYGYAIKIK